MPIYEYECQNCKFYTEVIQKISDPPLIKCPSCGKEKLQKLISAPVFRLKGSGWYETDFKSDKEGKRNLAEKEEAPAASGAEAKESKPAAEAKPAAAETAAPAAAEAKRRSATVSTSGKSAARAAPVKGKAKAAPSKAKPKPKPESKAPAKKKSRR